MTEAKKAEKKNRIVETATELFSKSSVSSIAVDDIVKACGIARGTFYLYFKDKSDLLDQIIMLKSREAMLSMMRDSSAQAKAANASFLEMSEILLNNFIDYLARNREVLTIIQRNISIVMKNAPDFGDEEGNRIYGLILDEMLRYGYDRRRAMMTLYLIVDMIGSTCSVAILTGKPYTITEIKPFVVDTVLNILREGAASSAAALQEGKDVPA